MLVLSVSALKVVAIPVSARHVNKRYYFVGYQTYHYDAILNCIDDDRPRLAVLAFKPRAITDLTDDELNERFRRKKKGGQCREVTKRKARYALIAPLVENEDSPLLFDPDCLKERVAARARQILEEGGTSEAAPNDSGQIKGQEPLQKLKDRIQSSLNQYWAGGSVPGALIGFASNCGGRGKRRKAGVKKRGRRNERSRDGAVGKEGLNVTADSRHAKIIKYCYDTTAVRLTRLVRAKTSLATWCYHRFSLVPT